jgi:imidazolonepropionase-like amidohydrolase
MKTLIVRTAIVLLGMLGLAQDVAAQNLVITNARILDGTGRAIQRGSVVVRDGKIVSVSEGAAPPAAGGTRVIDAQGMTVMPGFIDAHRHPVGGNADEWLNTRGPGLLQEFLDAGFTTIVSAGDAPQQVVAMRRRIERGQVRGPRLLAAGRIQLARGGGPPAAPAGGRGRGDAPGGRGGAPAGDPARFDRSRPPLRPTEAAGAIPAAETVAAVEAMAKLGVDMIKTSIIVTPGGPETETLALIAREGKKHNLPTFTHAVTVIDTLAAVKAGVTALAHTPHIGQLTPEEARTIAQSGIPMTSTLGIFIPMFSPDNMPLFRDRGPFPWETVSSGGQGPVNARMMTEAGLVYGFGTDTSWPPRDSLHQELRALHLMFSPKDIVSILTRNAASVHGRQDTLGTLEPGKLADIVIVNGDPLRDIYDVLNVVTTIKGGEVVSERRP